MKKGKNIARWFRKHPAFKIGLIYFVLSALWIFFSDKLILLISRNLQDLTHFQTVKGLFFIIATTVIIYFMIINEFNRKNQIIESINENERWYNTLFSNLPSADFFLFDLQMNFILAKGEEVKRLEIYPGNIAGKRLQDLPLPAQFSSFLKKNFKSILEGRNVKKEFFYNNEWFELRGSPLKTDEYDVYAGVAILLNITNHKLQYQKVQQSKHEAESLYEEYLSINEQLQESNEKLTQTIQQLEESEASYKTFIQQTNEGIYKFRSKKPIPTDIPVDEQVELIYEHAYIADCNNALAEIYGYSEAKDMLGMPLKTYHERHLRKKGKEILRKFIENGYELKNEESKEYTVNRKEIFLTKNVSGIVIDNHLHSSWGAQSNITKQKRFEKNLIKAKKQAEQSDKLKSAFLANMSHEIRTPLNGILGFSYLLTKDDNDEQQKQKFASIIKNNGKQLLNLINDILDLSKIEAGQLSLYPSRFSINKLMEEIYTQYQNNDRILQKSLNLQYEIGLEDNEDVIEQDRERLMQVLDNLLNNAIKFTDSGTIQMGYKQKDSRLEFYVSDTGMGIPEKVQKHIFNRFHQADESIKKQAGGTGLGLSICKGIMDLFNGEIWVESEEGKGSTFLFTIPFQKAEKQPQKVTTREKNWNFGDKKILVVEDDQNSMELLTTLLKSYKTQILSANTGEKAIQKCENDRDIDLVLMDIKLPGKDGYHATKAIKAVRPKLPVIAQTAYAMPEDKEKSSDYGFDGYLTKPIEEKELLETLQTFLQ